MATTQKNKVGVISMLLISGALFGYGVGYILGKSSDLLGQISWVWVIISVPFLYYFSVAWHELGHALAGLSVGFDWRVYVVGPFYFEKKDTNWQFSWNRNVNLSGGMVVALPTQSNGIAASFQRYFLGDQAAQSLTEYIDLKDELPDSFESMVWLDAAYFHAFLKRDWEKATEYLNKFKEFPFVSKSYIYATHAEIAWAKGDLDEFELWKSKSLEKLPKMMDKSQSAALSERFALVRI